MNTEETTIIDPLAVEIGEKHEDAEAIAQEATTRIRQAILARQEVGALVEMANNHHGKRIREWWTNNLPQIDLAVGKKYLQLHRIAGRSDADKRQLILAGLLPQPTLNAPQNQLPPDPLRWMRLVIRLTRAVANVEAESLPAGAKLAIRKPLQTLKDALVNLIERLGDSATEEVE